MLRARGTTAKKPAHAYLFVALDTPDVHRARTLARTLRGRVGGFKVGLELYSAAGPRLIAELREQAEVFVDLKLHDIPNTVAGAAAVLGRLGAAYLTVHASGGAPMIRRGVDAATEAADAAGLPAPVVLAVTVLTSHDDATLRAIGMAGPCADAVTRLAGLAREAGAGGLVCSALEVTRARRLFADGVLAVPGIRPASSVPVADDDQSRTAAPADVVRAGADLLVVGRPITRAADPVAAAEALAAEIERGVSGTRSESG